MIGGENYIKLKQATDSLLSTLSLACPGLTLYLSGRDSISSVLSGLSSNRLWLPDFLPPAVHNVALQTGKQINFYPINHQLLAEENWIDQVKKDDIVFVIHYFGIQQTALLTRLKTTGAVVISDISMMLYNVNSWPLISEQSTFVLGSLRSTFPVADGGFLSSRTRDVVGPDKIASEEFWVPRAAALLSRGGSANRGFMSNENSALFQKAEKWLDEHPADQRKISDCSRALLLTVSDAEWNDQRVQTHHNQAILATHLSQLLNCPQVRPTRTLPDIAVSQYFTFFVKNVIRDRIKKTLEQNKIYCPILWETPFLNPPQPLPAEILSIPCDARYSANDMKHIAKQILAQL